jgi:hypothetical protein
MGRHQMNITTNASGIFSGAFVRPEGLEER